MHKLFLFALTLAGIAQAALPPYPDRVRYFDAILRDKRVETAVTDPQFADKSSRVVDGVQFRNYLQHASVFEVTSGKCKLDVIAKSVAQFTADGHPILGSGKIVLTVGNSLRCP